MNAQFIDITTIEQLNEVFEVSNQKPVVLFKHSITCPISANVFEEVANIDSTVFLVTVQDSRDISDEIAKRISVKHESPQAIVLRNEQAVFSASHYDITATDITAELVHNSNL